MPPNIPPDAVIEALKQGNAIELEPVKKLKEGLNSVTDGLEKECYNRSDAFSELRENLKTVRERRLRAEHITNSHAIGKLKLNTILRNGQEG